MSVRVSGLIAAINFCWRLFLMVAHSLTPTSLRGFHLADTEHPTTLLYIQVTSAVREMRRSLPGRPAMYVCVGRGGNSEEENNNQKEKD